MVYGRAIKAFEAIHWLPEHAEAAEAVLRRRFAVAKEYWNWAEFEGDGLVLRLEDAD